MHKSFPFFRGQQPFILFMEMQETVFGGARNGPSKEDEQEVLKPTSGGFYVLGRVAHTPTGRWSGPSLCPRQITA